MITRGLLALMCMALVACGQMPDEAPVARPAAGEACAPIERPPLQAGSHLLDGAEPPVPYSSTPPTSGWHASGALDVSVHGPEDPLTEPEQVSVLEAEGVVISYRDIAPEDVEAINDLVSSDYDGRAAVTPYDELDSGQIALTAWGALQRCQSLDLEVVRAFLDEHAGDDVSPGH